MSDSLAQVGTKLTQVILPAIIIFGIVGNSLNITVLTRPALYEHACSRYFLAVAGNSLFYSGIFFIYRLLANGYQINLANYSAIACKITTYISTTSSFLSPYFIVFASIDRYCVSSRNAQIRKFSCIRVAKWMIFLTIIIFALLFINILVLADLQLERGSICLVQANTIYGQVYIITQVLLFAVIPPSLMMLFGFMTVRNSNRSRTIQAATSRYNRTEHQLARMLLLQVSVHILLTLPSSVTYLISALPNTIRITPIFSFVFTICSLLFYFSYVTSFFLYLLSGRMYRKELIRCIYTTFRIRYGTHIKPLANQNIELPVISLTHPQVTTRRQ